MMIGIEDESGPAPREGWWVNSNASHLFCEVLTSLSSGFHGHRVARGIAFWRFVEQKRGHNRPNRPDRSRRREIEIFRPPRRTIDHVSTAEADRTATTVRC
jgi:hypothetical protein